MTFLASYPSLLRILNPICIRAFEGGAALAMSRGHQEIEIEHLLLRLVEDNTSDAAHVLRGLGVPSTPLTSALWAALDAKSAGNQRPDVSPYIGYWIQDAWLRGSLEYGADRVRSLHLLCTLVLDPEKYKAHTIYGLLDALRPIDGQRLMREHEALCRNSAEAALRSVAAPAPGRAGGTDNALDKYTQDVTARVRSGKTDPVLGRDQEIDQLVSVLGRDRKNNPIIVGEAGVGKTALVEGLAQRIAAGQVPAAFKDVIIRSLDLGLLQAGAGVRGEFEARLMAVLTEVQASPRPIVLFIDEAHMLIGAGNQAGGGDAANLLKPALARGALRTIGATTYSEFKKYFESDAALSRRFQPVHVDEPDRDRAIDMLRGLATRYASQGVVLLDTGLCAAVELSQRYVSGRLLPDKAVDILDSCVARIRQAMEIEPRELARKGREEDALKRKRAARLRELEALGQSIEKDESLGEIDTQLAAVQAERKKLSQEWQTERTAAEEVLRLRSLPGSGGNDAVARQQRLGEALQALAGSRAPRDGRPMVPIEMDGALVAEVISEWTGIPVGSLMRDEAALIAQLEELLTERVRGQSAALRLIANQLRSSRIGLSDPNLPVGAFLLVGPSGTGKTETARAVADLFFGGQSHMTVVNMSEFQEKHTVSRLIGSPPGYVGFREGGVLTEALRRKPFSVVLLDEVEKAHPDILNLFLQVFDTGSLCDGEGRLINCRNAIFFLTSNLGSELLMNGQLPSEPERWAEYIEQLTALLTPVLLRHFQQALLNRLKVISYLPLSADVLGEIAIQKLRATAARLWDLHETSLKVDDAVVQALVDAAMRDRDVGARKIDHIIRDRLMPLVIERVMSAVCAGQPLSDLRLSLSPEGDFMLADAAPVYGFPPEGETNLASFANA